MSIKKVAKMAGVSIATVSRYFNTPELLKKETQEKVRQVSQKLNYQPNTLAQNFRRGRSGIIVIVVYSIGDPLYENFTRIITEIAQSKSYDVLIKETNYKNLPAEYYRDLLNSKQADGLIVMIDAPTVSKDASFSLDQLPIVFIQGGRTPHPKSNQHIALDNYNAAQTATQHLIDLGHENIACIAPKDCNTTYSSRKAGFNVAISKAKLRKPLIISLSKDAIDMITVVERIRQVTPKITGIFCIDDDLAIDVLSAMRRLNLEVPKDFSVVGFNNIRYAANTHPPLTTVSHPIEIIAQHAIETLCAMIDPLKHPKNVTETHPNQTLFTHHLVIRSSTSIPSI
jgi:LacI family transcriptional regulator, repressor for deo operon, udp, cdd, tsx, nupC, and nupG